LVRLILHSDDFGLHPAINDAILACARRGVLSSTSVLANGRAAREAILEGRKIEGLGIGVHLNIVRGMPISEPSAIRSVVNRHGRFLNSLPRLLIRSRLARLRAGDIYQEYKSQLLFVLRSGVTPTHLDSEKHSHLLLPQAAEAVRRLAREFGIRKVRRINERGLSKIVERPLPAGTWGQRIKLRLLEHSKAKDRATEVSTDYTFGISLAGCPERAVARHAMEALLQSRHDASVEWIFHLGQDLDYSGLRKEFGSFSLTAARSRETAFLLDEETQRLVTHHRSQVISYREL
jgi:predicted glycoside hydrolase/deacetylase ChbG (UPF0249 family)